MPLQKPQDVIPHLGKPCHWKQGRSAKSLADSWFFAGDIPAAIRSLLVQSEYLAGAELLEAWLERETDLEDGRATPSQTDLIALLGIGVKLAVLGIEAKVDESFGPFVSEWLEGGSEGKSRRLAKLCALFQIIPAEVGHLRYQLFHRTAAAILEAKRFRSNTAILIVQSFCPKATGLSVCSLCDEGLRPGASPDDSGTILSERDISEDTSTEEKLFLDFWVVFGVTSASHKEHDTTAKPPGPGFGLQLPSV